MDSDQEALLKSSDHTTPWWKTIDFPLIASVSANFSYTCKRLCTFEAPVVLTSRVSSTETQHRLEHRDRSQEKKREKEVKGGNYWASFENRLITGRCCKDRSYVCLKSIVRGNQICCSSMVPSFPLPWPHRAFFGPLGATFLELPCKHLLCCCWANNLTLGKKKRRRVEELQKIKLYTINCN